MEKYGKDMIKMQDKRSKTEARAKELRDVLVDLRAEFEKEQEKGNVFIIKEIKLLLKNILLLLFRIQSSGICQDIGLHRTRCQTSCRAI
jgi:hypothetical protein